MIIPERREAVDLRVADVEGMPCWHIVTRRAFPSAAAAQLHPEQADLLERWEGTLAHHVMPQHTLAARAEEYDLGDLDDDDVCDVALRMALHEVHVDPDRPDDPAAAAGYWTTIRGRRVHGALYTAQTIQDAREAHWLRVARVRETVLDVDHAALVSSGVRDGLLAGRRAEAHRVDGLRDQVNGHRRVVRGRGDGRPLRGTPLRLTAS